LIKKPKAQQQRQKRYRINQWIFASPLRVLDSTGKQIGVLPKEEALKLAQEQELDLVEVASSAKPPVAKIIDYNKFLYQLDKKKKEEKRKAKVSETKEIRLGPFMSDHDLQTRVRQVKGFLEDGDKVKLVVKFKGRQMAHTEFGKEIVLKVISSLGGLSKVDREPRFEGRQLVTILSADKTKKIEESA
jgi:translation initiation factor IF-3